MYDLCLRFVIDCGADRTGERISLGSYVSQESKIEDDAIRNLIKNLLGLLSFSLGILGAARATFLSVADTEPTETPFFSLWEFGA